MPLVVLVIFGLLYFTYHSAVEAAHVLLAVPFALTGGVYLLWLLDYNFSVAVWVGFIALFGTAVQTAVVMVIYLDEALRRKVAELGGQITRQDLRDAVIEGALLRLRPKLMTVSTVVAGLLPIMWSHRVGAEVMKPLATPVLGGMVSSLLHVLIVTPVLFYWIHERRLRRSRLESSAGLRPDTTYDDGSVGHDGDNKADVVSGSRRTLIAGLVILVAIAAVAWWVRDRQAGPNIDGVVVVETVRTADVVATLSNADGALRRGSNRFRIEFRSAGTNELLDVGTVSLSGTMTMPGMVMTSPTTIIPTGQPGVYDVTGEYGMAGSWHMTLEWNGPAGRGSAWSSGAATRCG